MNSSLGFVPVLFLIFVYGIIFLMIIGVFCLRAWGLYTMAKNTGMKSPWLAWIPLTHDYLAAQMADRYLAWRGKRIGYALWTVLFTSSTIALCGMMGTNVILSASLAAATSPSWSLPTIFVVLMASYALILLMAISTRVLQTIVHYHLYCDFAPDNVLAYTLLTVFGFEFICILLIRDNVPVAIAGSHPQGQPKYR